MKDVPHLNSLPVVIDGPGEYSTRSGGRVTIREIRPPHQDPTITSFRAAGSKWRDFRGRYRARGHDIWHVSGRRDALQEKPSDVVGRFEPKFEAALR